MASLTRRVTTVLRNPTMLAAYTRWCLTRLATGAPPRRRLAESVRIANWVSFSEYWSFRCAVPPAERLCVGRYLSGKAGKAVAFDIGANLGTFTCLMAARPAAVVHAFEPIPETFCRLKANVAANGLLGRCHLCCLAVGKENGLVTFRIQADSPATNRMCLPHKEPVGSGVNLQTVVTVRLDDYCRAVGLEQIDFMKIDVEGMEPYVLEGAGQLLRERRVGAVLIEICPANLQSVGLSGEVLVDTILGLDYTPLELLADGRPGRRLWPRDFEQIVLANALLLPAT